MNIKKSFLLLVVFLLAFSNAAFGAENNEASKKKVLEEKKAVEQKLVKQIKPDETVKQYKANDRVRVIVELEDEPVFSAAQSSGKNYSELSESSKKQFMQAALNAQEKVKQNIQKASITMDHKESFTTVFNGFSGEVAYKSIKVIESLSNVKKVYITHEYERPEEQPEMLYSKELVKAQQTWQDYGYKGEGMTVAVIDTGIDPSHKDMVLSDKTDPELSKEEVESLVDKNSLAGKYYSEKVPYGYNYSDENHEILDLGPDASMHGMHVAGTVGANGDEENGGIKGVAPEAQILGLKVFGNDPEMPSTYSDIYVKAIDDAIILGADVINMSLGSTASFVLPEDPEQQAIANAVENGVMMAISAGNSAKLGEGFANPLASNPDIGVVGSPGLTDESLQVASFENQYLDLEGFNVYVDGEEKEAVSFVSSGNAETSSLGNGAYELVNAGLGRLPGDSEGEPGANDFDGLNLEGKIALIQRGDIPFVTKALNAQAKGAVAVIIYNNASGYVNMVNDPAIKIPYIFTLKQFGDELAASLEAGKKVAVAFKGEKVKSLNPENSKMSEFTSWGVTPNLDFKPEITAPGGNILSTLQKDQYGLMSGTSMAAPHVAGGSALVMQRVDEAFDLKGSDRVNMAKNILMNTSKPQVDKGLYNDYYSTGLYYSPRRQGAGLMDLHAAMSTPVVVTEAETGIGKVALKEINDKASFKLKLTNFSDKAAVYKAEGTVQTDLVYNGLNLVETGGVFKKDSINAEEPFLGEFPIEITSANGSEVDGDYQVLVPANKTVEVEASIDLTDAIDWMYNTSLTDLFQNGYFAEGFITFTDVNDTNPELTVPYVGFNGEWDQAPVIDETIYDEGSFYGATGLAAPAGANSYNFLGTNPVVDEAFGDKVAFSPNGDGVQDNVLPILSFLRNAKNVKFKVLDSDEKEVLTLRTEKEIRKNYYDGGATSPYSVFNNASWDGKFKGEVLPDGLYYYQIDTVVDYPDADWQSKQIPVLIDTKNPEVSVIFDAETGKVSWNAEDKGAGVSHFDILVNGNSVLEKPLAADAKDYTLDNAAGVKNVKVVAYDWAGNTGADTAGEDDTIPFITALTPEALSVSNSRVVNVTGYVNDTSSVEALYINDKKTTLTWDAANERYAFNTNVEFKSDGVHGIRFVGVDKKGNEISFLRKVMIDSTKPGLDVQGPYYTNKDKVSLKLNLSDNYSEMRFYIDGSEKYYNQFREPYEMKAFKKELTQEVSLKDGENKFELKLTDLAGHTVVKNISIFKTGKSPKAFSDLKKDHWAKDAIQILNLKGVINGYDNGKFGVNDDITRLQAAQMIVRALGLDTNNRPNPKLKDVKPGDYGYDVIATVADEGIMIGNDKGEFKPKDTLLRAEMAKIIVEAYKLKGETQDSFKDVPAGYWATGYINTLAANNITKGYPDKTFKPKSNLTRSEFAVFLARIQDDRLK
ncbi:S8 family serine peptidase [Cytobacillus firmus]|uniref:S8 family serine peptidase n=1 Tax=Cytobacillus firmus TaxID=1399 RepID=UPI001CFD538C|nr:S8 family serine peptidase [Cytobacillus firmus]